MRHGGRRTRIVLLLALVAGLSYVASWNLAIGPGAGLVWKGAGVGLLAVYAALQARDADGWLVCAVMALGALGDVLIKTAGLTVGAVPFAVGHVVAVSLYLRNRRDTLAPGHRLFALLVVPVTVEVAAMLPSDRSAVPGIAFYALLLSIMAATAWISRFPRSRVGIGAILFVASDLLLFARLGPLADAPWAGVAVWVLYFGGQLLICVGVTATLAADPRIEVAPAGLRSPTID
jgi:uncharacterized membrane protein YhhN